MDPEEKNRELQGILSMKAVQPFQILVRLIEGKWDIIYIVDLIAVINTLVKLPATYEELTWHILSTIPKGCKHLDLVADIY